MGIDIFTDIELLNELIKRNGKSAAPSKIQLAGPWFSTIVGIGKDNVAEIIFTDEADTARINQ